MHLILMTNRMTIHMQTFAHNGSGCNQAKLICKNFPTWAVLAILKLEQIFGLKLDYVPKLSYFRLELKVCI